MNQRSLNVWINDILVGVIAEVNGLWAFTYDAGWLERPDAYELCPNLPLQADAHQDGGTTRPVQWFFDNLLPEEQQRALIARTSGAAIDDAFALLGYFGAESAGSITLLPPESMPGAGGELPLSFEELSARIRTMPEVPLASRSAKKMSLAGAQHKVAVIFRDDRLYEPTGNTPSTHILKPDHPSGDWAHSVINEWFIMTLAGRVGMPVPMVTRLYVPEPVYLVERFDRTERGGHWERKHCIDACQMLQLSREFKYSAGSLERIAELANLASIPARARLELFSWIVFNVLVGNEDAHLKNLSFLCTGRDTQLSPFYDLLCTAVYGTRAFGKDLWPQQAELAWPLLGVKRLQEVDFNLLVRSGEALGIRSATASQKIRQLTKQVSEKSAALLEEVDQRNAGLIENNSELRATFAGEMRLLRSIVHTIILEMAKQVAG